MPKQQEINQVEITRTSFKTFFKKFYDDIQTIEEQWSMEMDKCNVIINKADEFKSCFSSLTMEDF